MLHKSKPIAPSSSFIRLFNRHPLAPECTPHTKPERYETAKEPMHPFVDPGAKKEPPNPDSATRDISNEKWKFALAAMANEIKMRHYSPKTLKSYSLLAHNIRKFIKN